MPGQPLSKRRSPNRLQALGDRQGRLTHSTGKGFARLLEGLYRRPDGWRIDDAADDLGVSIKTIRRYITACSEALAEIDESPRIVIVERRGRRFVRLRPNPPPRDVNLYEAAALKLALSVFRVANGTVFHDLLAAVWEKVTEGMTDATRTQLIDIERKVFAAPYVEKAYAAHDARLDRVLRALIEQRRLRITYTGLSKTPQRHEFDPYTLSVYRGGLYLIGWSHLYHRVIQLAVERIKTVYLTKDETFEYPKRWSLARRQRGMFGIIDGESTRVELLVRDDATELFLRARRLGLGEKFSKRPNGTTVLTLRVRGVAELANWILGFGSHVEVLKPESLRQQVRDTLREASALYSSGPEPTRHAG